IALVVRDLATDAQHGRHALTGIGLAVAAGEICGVAGVDGNGQDELALALAGALPRRGTVVVHRRTVASDDVAAAIDAGIVLIPGDRKREGLAAGMTVWENACLAAPHVRRFTRAGAFDVARARAFGAQIARTYSV